MSKFDQKTFTNTATIVQATGFTVTVDVGSYDRFSVAIQNDFSACMAVGFFSLSHGISASLNKPMYMINSACAIADSSVELYAMQHSFLDQLQIKISATADITANELNISLLGKRG